MKQKTWNNNLPYYTVCDIKEKAAFYEVGQKFKFKTFSQKSCLCRKAPSSKNLSKYIYNINPCLDSYFGGKFALEGFNLCSLRGLSYIIQSVHTLIRLSLCRQTIKSMKHI